MWARPGRRRPLKPFLILFLLAFAAACGPSEEVGPESDDHVRVLAAAMEAMQAANAGVPVKAHPNFVRVTNGVTAPGSEGSHFVAERSPAIASALVLAGLSACEVGPAGGCGIASDGTHYLALGEPSIDGDRAVLLASYYKPPGDSWVIEYVRVELTRAGTGWALDDLSVLAYEP